MQQRQTATQRGYDRRWQLARHGYLLRNPLCVLCLKHGRIVQATTVDHIKPHRGDTRLFWNRANWQSLCTNHHNSTKQTIEHRGYSTEIGNDGWPIDPKHPANKRA